MLRDLQRESAAQILKQREEEFTAKIDSLGNKFEDEVGGTALLLCAGSMALRSIWRLVAEDSAKHFRSK